METRSQRRAKQVRQVDKIEENNHQHSNESDDTDPITIPGARGGMISVDKQRYNNLQDYSEMIPENDWMKAVKNTKIDYEYITTPTGGFYVNKIENAILRHKADQKILPPKYKLSFEDDSFGGSSHKKNRRFSCVSVFSFLVLLALIPAAWYNKEVMSASIDMKNRLSQYYLDFGRSTPEDRIDLMSVSLKNVKSSFENQDVNIWIQIFSRFVSIVKEPEKPSIIVLVGEDVSTLNCLTAMLADTSNRVLDSTDVSFSPKNLPNSEGKTLEKIRAGLQSAKTAVIWDFLNININAMKAFHALLDRYNPSVEEIVYLIVILRDQSRGTEDPLLYLENELDKKLRGKLKVDAISPLITRIMDGAVIGIKPEPNERCPVSKTYARS